MQPTNILAGQLPDPYASKKEKPAYSLRHQSIQGTWAYPARVPPSATPFPQCEHEYKAFPSKETITQTLAGRISQQPRTLKRWLDEALKELEELDDEIDEEELPGIALEVKKEAKRITIELANQPIAPSIYPTQDGEIALHFKSPVSPSTVVVLLSNDGQGVCIETGRVGALVMTISRNSPMNS